MSTKVRLPRATAISRDVKNGPKNKMAAHAFAHACQGKDGATLVMGDQRRDGR
jgi:hypothetical protein